MKDYIISDKTQNPRHGELKNRLEEQVEDLAH